MSIELNWHKKRMADPNLSREEYMKSWEAVREIEARNARIQIDAAAHFASNPPRMYSTVTGMPIENR